MVGDSEDGVMSLGLWEFCDEIEGYGLEWEGIWCWCDWVQWWFHGVRVDFVHLAVHTSSDVLRDVVLHARPPVVPTDCVGGFGDSRVSSREGVMKKLNYPPPKVIISHNDKSIALPPEATGPVFHIISSVPGFQLGMVHWPSLHMQHLSFDVVVEDLVLYVGDTYCVNIPFGIGFIRSCSIKAQGLCPEGVGLEFNGRGVRGHK